MCVLFVGRVGRGGGQLMYSQQNLEQFLVYPNQIDRWLFFNAQINHDGRNGSIRGNRHRYHWHRNDSSQNVRAKTQMRQDVFYPQWSS